ncbi:MAG: Short chain dehydrogenase [Labilithrix sp.]|nr:Short chain dehydrogenase [Labilithrix sp.]
MRRILVTGANKGIGLAIVRAILTEQPDTFVYLGSRDRARGLEATTALTKDHDDWSDRVAPLAIDVTDEASVAEAAAQVEGLHAIVNNAGINGGGLVRMLETNTLGVHRVCQAFIPRLDAGAGRIVNVTSASGPLFVSTCSPEMQRFFLDASLPWPRLQAFIEECRTMAGDVAAFRARGLGEGEPYGLSKACANTYTLILAREHPALRVNACTPGFIATDLTLPHFASSGKSSEELGMKTPAEGARAPLHLLFAELEGNGHFYGSDSKRSPLDRYRAPGSPPFTGT